VRIVFHIERNLGIQTEKYSASGITKLAMSHLPWGQKRKRPSPPERLLGWMRAAGPNAPRQRRGGSWPVRGPAGAPVQPRAWRRAAAGRPAAAPGFRSPRRESEGFLRCRDAALNRLMQRGRNENANPSSIAGWPDRNRRRRREKRRQRRWCRSP